MSIEKYINELKIESDTNYISLNKIITEIKDYDKEISNIRKEIIKKKKYIFKYFISTILISLTITITISLITFILNYIPNVLFYLLISLIGGLYIFINKYINIKYKNIKNLNLKLEKLIEKNKLKEVEKQKVISRSKITNNKIKVLKDIVKDINIYITGKDAKEDNRFIFLNYESEKTKVLKKL